MAQYKIFLMVVFIWFELHVILGGNPPSVYNPDGKEGKTQLTLQMTAYLSSLRLLMSGFVSTFS